MVSDKQDARQEAAACDCLSNTLVTSALLCNFRGTFWYLDVVKVERTGDQLNTRWCVCHKHSVLLNDWNQFLLVVKATAPKQQISNFYPQIQRTDASDGIYVSHWPVVNVKASFCAYNLRIKI